jgi:hypothetical protein
MAPGLLSRYIAFVAGYTTEPRRRKAAERAVDAGKWTFFRVRVAVALSIVIE